MVDRDKPVFALRHLENGSFICVLKESVDYLICYSQVDAAVELRAELCQEEFCEVCSVHLGDAGIRHIWLDGCYMEIASDLAGGVGASAPPVPPC